MKVRKLRNEYFSNRNFLVVQNLRFVLSAFLQQIRVEQKSKKQGEGEKENRVKARERQVEIKRRQIKNAKNKRDECNQHKNRWEIKCFTFAIPCITIQFL